MDLSTIFNFILAIITLIAGGGWFINYRAKKSIEQTTASSDKVDLTDKILEKYQKTVLDTMSKIDEQYEKQHEDINQKMSKMDKQISKIFVEIKNIEQYLNGDFEKFKNKKF